MSQSRVLTCQPETLGDGLLFRRSFFGILATQALTNLAYWNFLALLQLQVLTHVSASRSVVFLAVLFFVGECPLFLFGPIAGVYVDRWMKQRILRIACAGLLVSVLLPLAFGGGEVFWCLLVSAACSASMIAVFMPAKTALIREHCSSSFLSRFSYISAAIFTATAVLGSLVATVLYLQWGYVVTSGVISVLLVLALGCSICIPAQHTHQGQRSNAPVFVSLQHSWTEFLTELHQGMAFILRHRIVWCMLLTQCCQMFGSALFASAYLVFFTQQFHASLLIIRLAISGGTVLGMLCVVVLLRHIPARILFAVGIIAMGIGTVLFALPFQLWVSMVFLGLACVAQASIDVGLGPIQAEAVPSSYAGRVHSSIDATMTLAGLAGYGFCMGFQFLSPQFLLALAGGIIMLGGCLSTWGMAQKRNR